MNRLLIFALLNIFTTNVLSQKDVSSDDSTDTTWKDTEQIIEVQQKVADQAIEQRFKSILELSNRIHDANVEVKEGVLILSGWADDEGDREWVENPEQGLAESRGRLGNRAIRGGRRRW